MRNAANKPAVNPTMDYGNGSKNISTVRLLVNVVHSIESNAQSLDTPSLLSVISSDKDLLTATDLLQPSVCTGNRTVHSVGIKTFAGICPE